jgi:predicted phosphodiesterase
MISALLGFDFKEEHIEVIKKKKFYFVHGDRWDYIIQLRPFLTEIASGLYYFLQKIDKKQKLTRKLKKKIKTWRSSAGKVMVRVAHHARSLDCQVCVFGHTHMPEHTNVEGIECINLGSQCDLPITYCMIDNKGKVILRSLDY